MKFFDREESWQRVREALPAGAAVASIILDALSLYLAIHLSLLLAMVVAVLSAGAMVLMVWAWVNKFGISGFDSDYVIEERRDELYFDSARKVLYKRKMKIRVKNELKALTYFLARGQGIEHDFHVFEIQDVTREESRIELRLMQQRIAGRPALIISRDTPFVPTRRYIIVVQSTLIDAFPDCKAEGFSVGLPPLLREYQLEVVIPAHYFKDKPILKWFKTYRNRALPLDQGEVKGGIQGDAVKFFLNLSDKLNSKLGTEFSFIWKWEIPSEECRHSLSSIRNQTLSAYK